MNLAILQSNYIPWKGYFDIINAADKTVIFDTRQYTKNDWRNRYQILIGGQLHWLTIPVKASGRFGQRICDTETGDFLGTTPGEGIGVVEVTEVYDRFSYAVCRQGETGEIGFRLRRLSSKDSKALDQ